jgi:hypothetical protein
VTPRKILAVCVGIQAFLFVIECVCFFKSPGFVELCEMVVVLMNFSFCLWLLGCTP